MAVIEIVRFQTKPGTDQAAFVALNERFQREIAPQLPGLERREAAQGAAGEWLLVLRYKDMESAKRGPQLDKGMEVAGAFMSMIEMPTMSSTHHTVMSE